MGRAIVRDPQVFLFDEPLSNLDAKLRVQMRLEIRKLQKKLGVTSIFVTHDQVEAMTLGDRLLVLNGGVVEQFGTPIELYDRPETVFVAGFIGSPAMNFLPATAESGVLTLDNGASCRGRRASAARSPSACGPNTSCPTRPDRSGCRCRCSRRWAPTPLCTGCWRARNGACRQPAGP